MIKELLQTYGSNYRKTWEHDRLSTVGSSEVGQCLRKTAYGKWEVKPDEGYEDGWGAQLRGTIIEDHYWVPALRATLPPGASLLYAGTEQQTFALGFLSATPDGLLTGLPRDCLSDKGVPDIGPSRCIGLETKSHYPGAAPQRPRYNHDFQVNTALGLVRRMTDHQPDFAVITYIDCSFLDKVTEFVIQYDERKYLEAEKRALQAIDCRDPLDMPPEGMMWGGNECNYCPWAVRCQGDQIRRMPGDNGYRLPPEAVPELKELRDLERKAAELVDTSQRDRAAVQEAIKQWLREHNVRAHRETDGSWSVQWSTVKSRVSLDQKAMVSAGIDLEPFQKEGKEGERLNIT